MTSYEDESLIKPYVTYASFDHQPMLIGVHHIYIKEHGNKYLPLYTNSTNRALLEATSNVLRTPGMDMDYGVAYAFKMADFRYLNIKGYGEFRPHQFIVFSTAPDWPPEAGGDSAEYSSTSIFNCTENPLSFADILGSIGTRSEDAKDQIKNTIAEQKVMRQQAGELTLPSGKLDQHAAMAQRYEIKLIPNRNECVFLSVCELNELEQTLEYQFWGHYGLAFMMVCLKRAGAKRIIFKDDLDDTYFVALRRWDDTKTKMLVSFIEDDPAYLYNAELEFRARRLVIHVNNGSKPNVVEGVPPFMLTNHEGYGNFRAISPVVKAGDLQTTHNQAVGRLVTDLLDEEIFEWEELRVRVLEALVLEEPPLASQPKTWTPGQTRRINRRTFLLSPVAEVNEDFVEREQIFNNFIQCGMISEKNYGRLRTELYLPINYRAVSGAIRGIERPCNVPDDDKVTIRELMTTAIRDSSTNNVRFFPGQYDLRDTGVRNQEPGFILTLDEVEKFRLDYKEPLRMYFHFYERYNDHETRGVGAYDTCIRDNLLNWEQQDFVNFLFWHNAAFRNVWDATLKAISLRREDKDDE